MSGSDTVYDPNAPESGLTAAEVARLPFRMGVGAVLFNRERQVFAAQRADMMSAAWQMPQGGIDKGEAPEVAVFRELEEEIGTANARMLAESREWLSYDLPLDLVPKLWKGRYRGQKQKWFALEFLGTDEEIDIFGPHAEFKAWKWADFRELPALIVPFKRSLYQAVLAEFENLAED